MVRDGLSKAFDHVPKVGEHGIEVQAQVAGTRQSESARRENRHVN